jgi:hypothetical protein
LISKFLSSVVFVCFCHWKTNSVILFTACFMHQTLAVIPSLVFLFWACIESHTEPVARTVVLSHRVEVFSFLPHR